MKAASANLARQCFLVLLLGALLSATTVIPMSIEELTSAADVVVRAHATEAWSTWNPERTLIYTYTRFRVEETHKGRASAVITVKQLGGSAEGYTQRVAGVRAWSPGDSAVLFLRPSEARDGTFVVVGLMQGDFRIHYSPSGERVASNGMPESAHDEVSSFQPSTREMGAYTGSQLSASDLEMRIRKAVDRAKETQ